MNHSYRNLELKLGRSGDLGTGLDPIPRQCYRGDSASVAAHGHDCWQAFEVMFLRQSGRPVATQMQCQYPADSPNIVESKSLKLFLNSLSGRRFDDRAAFAATVRDALTHCVQAEVQVELFPADRAPIATLPGRCIDEATIFPDGDRVDPDLLTSRDAASRGQVYSHLFQTHCPVTGQPDWATIWIAWRSPRTIQASDLLAYLISYRHARMFHEAVCESIFAHLHAALGADELEVRCYFTRRGGITINPSRRTHRALHSPDGPIIRQ